MNTFVFQPGMTWRKLGFALYSNSLNYREVLEQNPSWNVTELPPPGASLKKPSQGGSNGGSTQLPSVFSVQSAQPSSSYFPFETENEYFMALSKYSSSVLRQIRSINGLTSDSYPAITGIQ